jgi:ComF family protein
MKWLTRLIRSGIQYYPRYCLVCGKKTDASLSVCGSCLHTVSPIKQACSICCTQLFVSDAVLCGRCIKCLPSFDHAVIPFYYAPPITQMICALKFQADFRSLSFFAQCLARKIRQRKQSLPEVMIPVPLYKKQLKKRGYNQAIELAKRLKYHFDIPIERHYCRKIKETASQQSLNARLRLKNVKHAFSVNYPPVYQHAAIIDDVMTTGATVNEIARLLKQKGMQYVEVWCLARA